MLLSRRGWPLMGRPMWPAILRRTTLAAAALAAAVAIARIDDGHVADACRTLAQASAPSATAAAAARAVAVRELRCARP